VRRPNESGGDFGIVSKMQARSVDPAAEAYRKSRRRCRRAKGRIENRVSTGREKADTHRSIDPRLDKTDCGERRQIGQLAMANFTGWNRVERYEPKGSRGPEGERQFENRRSVLELSLATGNER